MILYSALYRLAILVYSAAIYVASFFNEKAKLFVAGRKDLLSRMRSALAGDTRKFIWMHCASLGEFEQGRPVLEALKEQYPQYGVVLTFFSPSGYEVRKDYKGADHVFYLPVDTAHNARAFLDIVNPALCLFVKYEFWYQYLSQIKARAIPAVLVSAVFSKEQGFFKWYGGLLRYMLRCFTHIFVQDKASAQLLESIKITHVTVSGDTRFDRVIMAAGLAEDQHIAKSFTEGHKVLVAGSTWPADETFLHKVLVKLPQDWKLILVPHEVDGAHIAAIEKVFGNRIVKWSAWRGQMNKRVLLVDKVGLLLHLYRYGTVAWIGGGFDKDGVHNVLEAAVYGIPCFYGPVYDRFIEAKELIAKGGGFTIDSPQDMIASLQELEDALRYEQHAVAAREYVLSSGGATSKILTYLGGLLSDK